MNNSDGANLACRDWEEAFSDPKRDRATLDIECFKAKADVLERIIEEKDEIIFKITKELEELKSLIRNIRP